MENPTTKHLNAVKQILCYIAGTIDYVCYYKGDGKELKRLGNSDADIFIQGRAPPVCGSSLAPAP
jgi:hypothetical protein